MELEIHLYLLVPCFSATETGNKLLTLSCSYLHQETVWMHDLLTGWLTDWPRVYINGAQKADGVNRWSALTGRPALQLTMPVNFVHFQCAKVKFWSLLTNIPKLVIAKQQHIVFISNVTFHLIPNKNIKVFCGYADKEIRHSLRASILSFVSRKQNILQFEYTSLLLLHRFSKIILFFSKLS